MPRIQQVQIELVNSCSHSQAGEILRERCRQSGESLRKLRAIRAISRGSTLLEMLGEGLDEQAAEANAAHRHDRRMLKRFAG